MDILLQLFISFGAMAFLAVIFEYVLAYRILFVAAVIVGLIKLWTL